MIAALQQEKADEIKHKDFCVEEFNQNQLATEKKTRQKNDLEASIDDLNMNIKQLTADLDNLKAQIAEMKTQMKRAGEDREKKNKQAGGVQGMIQTIIDDAKAMENEAIVAEEDAQKGYENFVKDSNASIDDKTKEIVEKTE